MTLLLAGALGAVLDRSAPKMGSPSGGSGSADVRRLIPFQAYVTDSDGRPVSGAHDLVFRMFDRPDGGSPMSWTELHAGVPIVNGLANVTLGSRAPFANDFAFDQPVFVEVQVDADPPLSPRQQYVPSAHAVWASGLRAPRFQAYSGEGQTITLQANSTEDDFVVSFEEIVDPFGAFLGRDTFIAPRDGYYMFNVVMAFGNGNGTDDTILIAFLENAKVRRYSAIANPLFSTRVGQETQAANNAMLYLRRGDSIQIGISHIDDSRGVVVIRERSFSGFYLGN